MVAEAERRTIYGHCISFLWNCYDGNLDFSSAKSTGLIIPPLKNLLTSSFHWMQSDFGEITMLG